MARLAPKVKVLYVHIIYLFCSLFIHSVYKFYQKILRDGKWNEKDASMLVPGDMISIKLGDITALRCSFARWRSVKD
ncbi:putative P-type H(+)-exporting transporter [Helianthus debilis subsp. tardiflorus]